MLYSLGLVTITLGVDSGVLKFADTVERFGPQVEDSQTYGARLAIVMIGSLLIGAIIGTALRIQERIEGRDLLCWAAHASWMPEERSIR